MLIVQIVIGTAIGFVLAHFLIKDFEASAADKDAYRAGKAKLKQRRIDADARARGASRAYPWFLSQPPEIQNLPLEEIEKAYDAAMLGMGLIECGAGKFFNAAGERVNEDGTPSEN